MNQQEWLEKYYQGLEGYTVIATSIDSFGFPVLLMQKGTGGMRCVEVSRDEEGNGPGFLFGLPAPKTEEN